VSLLKTYSIVADITSGDLGETRLHRELEDAGDIVGFTGINRAGDAFEIHGTSYTEANVDATVLAHVKPAFAHQKKSYAEMYYQGNATDTVIVTINVPVKTAGATTAGEMSADFVHTEGRLQYIGERKKRFHVISCAASKRATGTGTKLGRFSIYHYDDSASSGGCVVKTESSSKDLDSGLTETTSQGIIEMDKNDYVEHCTENRTDAEDLLTKTMTFIVNQI